MIESYNKSNNASLESLEALHLANNSADNGTIELDEDNSEEITWVDVYSELLKTKTVLRQKTSQAKCFQSLNQIVLKLLAEKAPKCTQSNQ